MTLFTLPFQHPVEFWCAVAMVTVILGIAFAAAKSPERRDIRWVKAITSPKSWDRYFQIMPPSQKHIAAWTAQRGAQFVTKMTAAARQKTLDVLVDEGLIEKAEGETYGVKFTNEKFRERFYELANKWKDADGSPMSWEACAERAKKDLKLP